MKHMKHAAKFILLCMLVLACVSPGWAKSFKDLVTEIGTNTSVKLSGTYEYTTNTDSSTYTSGVVISKSITIDGNGATIDGKSAARVFNIYTPSSTTTPITVTIKNLTIQNGSISNTGTAKSTENNRGGAGIYALNTKLVLDNVKFKGNITTNSGENGNPSDSGGALLIETTKEQTYDVTITNCIFSDNKAKVYAGAIYTWPEGKSTLNITIDDCEFSGNIASEAGAVSIQSNFENLQSDTSPGAKLIDARIKNSVFKGNFALASGV